MYRPKQSAKQRLYWLFKNKGNWVSKREIESKSEEWGYNADNLDRRCREMAKAGTIDKRMIDGYVQYRLRPEYPTLNKDEANELLSKIAKEQGVLNV
jgi:hypothetical protein